MYLSHWQVSFIHPITGERRIVARYSRESADGLAAEISGKGARSVAVVPVGREYQAPL